MPAHLCDLQAPPNTGGYAGIYVCWVSGYDLGTHNNLISLWLRTLVKTLSAVKTTFKTRCWTDVNNIVMMLLTSSPSLRSTNKCLSFDLATLIFFCNVCSSSTLGVASSHSSSSFILSLYLLQWVDSWSKRAASSLMSRKTICTVLVSTSFSNCSSACRCLRISGFSGMCGS